ncbi:PadR family transcriptional regulator [Sinobaca sp. H24]|uniref:PadR family transcriptional regulator n=1 Tax=Sinobaca sp. H24 TaxID=2923376 RepID=UPI0020797216|nr:PadR family transcriptional regulator [Sinobaca sp. H24]
MGRKDSISSGDLTDTHYYILLSLMTPMHGYAVMQKVEDLTEGHVVMALDLSTQ